MRLGSATRSDSAESVLNPGSTFCSCIRLRPSRPAPHNTVSASAISAITNDCRISRPRRDPDTEGAPSRSAVTRDPPVAPIAGASPQTSVVNTVTTAANASTLGSIVTCESSGIGRREPTHVVKPLRIQTASNTPSAPPAIDSISDSLTSWVRRRLVPAPIAERIASSRRRPDARVSIKLPMLPHAISSTAPTAPKSTSTASRTSPTSCSRSGTRLIVHPVLKSGCSARTCANTPSISA